MFPLGRSRFLMPTLGSQLGLDFVANLSRPLFLTLPCLGPQSRAYDLSGQPRSTPIVCALNGGLTTVPANAGVLGAAWQFDGATGYGVGTGDLLGGATSCSLACWVLVRNVGVGNIRLFAAQEDSGGIYSCALADYDGLASRGLRFWVKTSVGQSFADSGVGWAQPNRWYFCVGTLDGADINLYINGVLSATGSLAGGAIVAGQPLMFGKDILAGGRYLNGSLAMVAAWRNVALSAAQVSALYSSLLYGEPYRLFAPSAMERFYGLSAARRSGLLLRRRRAAA